MAANRGLNLPSRRQKFLAAKSNRSAAYMDKLNADMRLFLSHFGADRSIDRVRSDEIEDFLDSKKAASRRRNNLRSEVITLFRYAQIRIRALHRDRKTEAELVLRVKKRLASWRMRTHQDGKASASELIRTCSGEESAHSWRKPWAHCQNSASLNMHRR